MVFFDYYHKLLKFIVIAMFMGLSIVVSYQLLSRNVEFIPRFSFTEEISRWMFVWVVFIGAAIGVRENGHFVIDFFSKGSFLNKYLDLVTIVVLYTISLLLIIMGYKFFQSGLLRVSPISGLTLGYPYAALPVSGFSMLIFTLEKTLKLNKNYVESNGNNIEKALDEEERR